MDFFPLHVYTGYSFLKSGLSLPFYVAMCKKRGQSFCALSDFQTLSGFPEFTALCEKESMTPVYGMDFVCDEALFTAFIQDETGYKNLIQIALACSKGELTMDILKPLTAGLRFVLDLGEQTTKQRFALGETEFASYLSRLSRALPSLSLGLSYLPGDVGYVAAVRSFVAKYPYPLIAFPHVRYAKRDDAIAVSIVEAIAHEETLTEKSKSGDQWFLDETTLSSFFEPEELAWPKALAATCRFVFAKKRGQLPRFPSSEGLDSKTLLRKQAEEGLRKRLNNPTQAHYDRLDYELSIIERMGYCDYFLIVADYVNYAKTHGISVGPGRGSGAGSLVSFALGIVTPDPLQYGLLFERFLNPERQSMPDIDVDFADIRRDEVAVYLQQKYGHDRVAHIVTMQTLGAKASVRDVGRVFGYEPRHIDTLSKAIGQNNLSLRQNYRENAAFRQLVDSDPYYLEIVSLAAKIEGLPRQAGLHAAGIVLSEEPLSHVIPVSDNPGVGLVAQYEMNYLEEQGVLKMDLLGLRNLTLVDHCLDLLEARRGIKLDYAAIPYEDPEGIKLIASGKTMGLFQLESPGMNRAIATVKPTAFTDVVAVIALFRPGPMENIPSFARRKAGKEPITYLSPLLEPVLRETYGVIVYQEQIMQIVTTLAGYSYGQADLFRRAVSKKDAAKLSSLKEGFIKGCLSNGVDQATATKVYDLIYKFADYGFNKSHALVYAILACQMAYLKRYYPLEFYCSILDGTSANDPKFNSLVFEIKESGYRFRLPDVNKASTRFIPDDEGIVFPLTAIKGMQGALATRIVEERQLNGPYKDFFDFALRNKKNGLNLSLLVKLIDAGACDCFGYSRPRLRLAADSAIRYAEMLSGDSGNALLLDFHFPTPEIPMLSDDRPGDLLSERETLGMMVSGSPLENKADVIESEHLLRLRDLPKATGPGVYAAVVAKAKAVTTKKGTKMAFVTLYDEESVVEVAMFSEAYDVSYPCLKEGTLVKAHIHKNKGREGYLSSRIEYL